ncbi:AMP-dependent synthetase [Nocardioides marmoriginsengisoli]|uniref:AMP-dependent synthetase n=2 Tax=Nocardioides marmoriginsengisoli TaxID=661483 RepID=A0A3N0CJA1_9ACTN|nr:AMP-dependent synthetase [Nocardioides marmoriginsengisoli]
MVIETSGSTGRPKRVMLSRDAMRASALATQERLGGPGQWVLNLPPTYVAGVQVLYRSVVAGTEPVVFEEWDDFESVWRRMDADRRYVSLVPTQLHRQLKDGFDVQDLSRFTRILVGGGPLDPAVRAEAETMQLAIVQTYGMSETCGGCVYDGVPLDGVEIRIEDDGQVLLRGPMLFDGYQDEPERTEAAFRDGWLITHDLGHWAEDGRLRIDGRTDDMIISGGVKVPAQAVAAMIAVDDGVLDVVVVGVPDPEWGERVVAVVEPNDPITLADLRDAVEPRSWAPRQLVLVQEIPRLPNGKPDRLALKRLATDG